MCVNECEPWILHRSAGCVVFSCVIFRWKFSTLHWALVTSDSAGYYTFPWIASSHMAWCKCWLYLKDFTAQNRSWPFKKSAPKWGQEKSKKNGFSLAELFSEPSRQQVELLVWHKITCPYLERGGLYHFLLRRNPSEMLTCFHWLQRRLFCKRGMV